MKKRAEKNPMPQIEDGIVFYRVDSIKKVHMIGDLILLLGIASVFITKRRKAIL